MKMKFLGAIVAFLLISFSAHSHVKVSLLTCEAGDDIYSIFGHSAIRVVDTVAGTDLVYNFGMFSFSTDNFLYKFVKGETYYWVEAERYKRFMRHYKREGRAVYESVLMVDQKDALQIQKFLEWNVLPENSVYLYSYMFDNCATRIRDIAENLAGDSVVWTGNGKQFVSMPDGVENPEMFAQLYSGEELTYRDLLNKYLPKIPWINWGIFFSVAAPSDSEIPYEHTMFLPEFLMNGFQNAVYYKDGTAQDLVSDPIMLLESRPQPVKGFELTPLLVFSLLLLVVAGWTFAGYKKNRHFWGIDMVLLILLGLYGSAGAFVSWISIHPATFPNYNMLWASPLHLIVGVLVVVPVLRRKFLSRVYSVFLVMLLLYFVCIVFQLQALHWANVPLIGVFVLRYFLGRKVVGEDL